MTADRLARVLAALDAVHREDPRSIETDAGAQPAELVYARRMEDWVHVLAPDASEALRVAARGQHLARWRLPRTAHPEGRAGYHAWRRELGKRHGDDTARLCREAGYDDLFAERVRALVMKRGLGTDPEAQVLEDAACLVFLAHEYAGFAAKHDDGKVLGILQKTWEKMSPRARELARGLSLSGRPAALLAQALAIT